MRYTMNIKFLSLTAMAEQAGLRNLVKLKTDIRILGAIGIPGERKAGSNVSLFLIPHIDIPLQFSYLSTSSKIRVI